MRPQKIVIFGASGKVGRLVVAEALARGYEVVGFVHRQPDIATHPMLSLVQGDIHTAEDVAQAVSNADIVVSTLGSWGTKQKDILSTAMKHIIPAMQSAGIQRVVSLTGAEARARGDDLGIIHRIMHVVIGIVGGKVLRDSEQHIQLLEQSGLDWTVIRSPIMTSGNSLVHTLTTIRPLPWRTVCRRAVAAAMLSELAPEYHSQEALFIK